MRAFIFLGIISFGIFTVSNTVLAADYQKILNESKNIVEIEQKLPDFAVVVFNDESMTVDQKHDLVGQYSKRTDGEYSESFSCDCFDYVEKVYLRQNKKIDNKDFLYFLLKKAIWCDFTSGLIRYQDNELKDFVVKWEKLKNIINVEDNKIKKDIEENISNLKKWSREE